MLPMSTAAKGIALAVTAGVAWGSMGVWAQSMMNTDHFSPEELVGIRLAGAGLILCLVGFFNPKSRPFIRKLLTDARLCFEVAVYGLALLGTQFSFFLAIEASNAATAAIMVMTCPLMVLAWQSVRARRLFTARETAAFLMATAGVMLIVTKGDFTTLDLSWAGVGYGLLSSFFGAIGTLWPARAVRELDVSTVVGWGMLTGGIIGILFTPAASYTGVWSLTAVFGYAYIVLIGTAFAFFCYLKSTGYVPASMTSLLVAFEPLSAVVLSILLLGTGFSLAEAIGALLIFGMLFVLKSSR